MTISPECLNCTNSCEVAYAEAARQIRVPTFIEVFGNNIGPSKVIPVPNPVNSVLERLRVGSEARGCTLTPEQIGQRLSSTLMEQVSTDLEVRPSPDEHITSQPMPGGFLAITIDYPHRG